MDVKIRIMKGGLIALLVAGVVGWTYKMVAPSPATVNRSSLSATKASVNLHNKALFAEEEDQREIYLEQQRELQEIAKLRAKKEMTHECQFWRLQKKLGKSPVADKKIHQHCVLSGEQTPAKL